MSVLNRKKKDISGVPAEVQNYYKTEKRDHVGVAWLLAIATFVVTLIVALALFWGGRWIYRHVINNDDDNTSQTQDQGQTSSTSTDVPSSNDTQKNNSQSNTDQQSSSGSSSTGGSSSSTSSSSTNLPGTGATDQPTQLVDTGPGDE